MPNVQTIKKQKIGRLNEQDRLDLINLLAKAGYVVQQYKLPGKSEYAVRFWEPEEDT